MAPVESTKTTSFTRNPRTTPVDDDDKWLEVMSEKEDEPIKPQPTQTRPTPPAPQPFQPTHPHQSFPPPPVQVLPQGPLPLPSTFDSFGRPINPTSRLPQLENELIELASIELGLLNALDVLQKHLLKGVEHPIHRDFTSIGDNWTGLNLNSNPFYNERTYATQNIREMGHLIGLSKAIQLLRDALADKDRVEIAYQIKLVKPTPPPPPPSISSLPSHPLVSHSPSYGVQEREFKAVAKEVVKDAIREYSEDSQKEMIKLVRDVCLNSLQKN